MKCSCGSERILHVSGKCSDMCVIAYDGKERDGYVPGDLGIGGGDYIELELCLDCGKLVGEFPVREAVVLEKFGGPEAE